MNETTQRMFLTTAVLAAAAALLAGPAQAVLLDAGGGGGGDGAAAAVPVEPGTIPYLSHGIGVDESQFSGLPSIGLTGDSALTRVVPSGPEGLTGDSAATRTPEFGSRVTGGSGVVSDDGDRTWIGFGAGLAALLAATLMGVYLSARHRGRVALP